MIPLLPVEGCFSTLHALLSLVEEATEAAPPRTKTVNEVGISMGFGSGGQAGQRRTEVLVLGLGISVNTSNSWRFVQ